MVFCLDLGANAVSGRETVEDSHTAAHTYIHEGSGPADEERIIVYCPVMWLEQYDPETKLPVYQMHSLAAMMKGAKMDRHIANLPNMLIRARARIILHEVKHQYWRSAQAVAYDITYQPGHVAKLASFYGCKKAPTDNTLEHYGGYWVSTLNADSYAIIATIIYFRQQSQQTHVIEPNG
jgi:hypothetical protein